MHLVEAHGLLAMMAEQARPGLPCTATYDGEDIYPALATALALLSGALDDATTPLELAEAVEHGCSLFSCGVISASDIRHTTFQVIKDIVAWGDQRMAVVMPPDGVNLICCVGPCWRECRRGLPLPKEAIGWSWGGAKEVYAVESWPWKATDNESLPAQESADRRSPGAARPDPQGR